MASETPCDKSNCICGKQNDKDAEVVSPSNLSDNDIWASSDDEHHDRVGFENEQQQQHQTENNQDISALRRRHENKGYYDGLTKGKDSGLQKGFDLGYPVGAQLGGLVGELIAETIWKFNSNQIDENKKNEILKELSIEKILSSDYFDSNLDIKNPLSHPLIQKWSSYLGKI